MLRRLRGELKLEVTGASAELCLNRWTRGNLPFWEMRVISPLVFHCRSYASCLPALEREAARAQCSLRVLERRGLPVLRKRLRSRPVLIPGLILALLLSLYLQNYVWFVRVEGNGDIPPERLLRALTEEGVRFGAWGPGLDSEDLKNRMLNRVPELRWLAVNREGGLVTVLCAERQPEEPALDRSGIAHVTASRAGVIRELRVLEGFPEKAVGDPVEPGEILISGLMDWSTHTQATRARGEVYAETLHMDQLICPAEALEKRYTGRVEICRSVIFQRKRRKISGNSGIFGTMCDRMIETEEFSLPGGFLLPLRLETETLREYDLVPVSLTQQEAAELLEAEALRQNALDLAAGRLIACRTQIERDQDSFLCRAALNCLELISRTTPVELFGEEEAHGETDQRRTN